MNTGAKTVITIVSILVALFIAFILLLIILGGFFFTSTMQITPAAPMQLSVEDTPVMQLKPGDIIVEMEDGTQLQPVTELPTTLNTNSEVEIKIDGKTLRAKID